MICEAILSSLYISDYGKLPNTLDDRKKLAHEFEDIWNMPHCLGSIKGKHIAMRQPEYSGHLWYKGYFNLPLLVICDLHPCREIYILEEKYKCLINSIEPLQHRCCDLIFFLFMEGHRLGRNIKPKPWQTRNLQLTKQ